MSKSNIELGRRGEQLAVNFLKNNGYNIISTNYRTRLGQVDIIAKDKKTICFVEVKTRRATRFGHPYEAVVTSKQCRISRVSLMYLKQNGLKDLPARFDVVSISYPECSNSLRITSGCRSNTSKSSYIRHTDEQPKIELIKNAFELDHHYLY